MPVPSPTRRFDPERLLPAELLAEIDHALDIAEDLYERGMQIAVRRPGPPRRVRIDLRADADVLCELEPSELLELGAGRLQLSQ